LKVLFDTHAFLWAITEDPRLSTLAKKTFIYGDNEILLSVASVWEIVVKAKAGKLPFPHPASSHIRAQLRKTSTVVLPMLLPHVLQVENLPLHHRDPFDRIILAQAIEEKLPIVSGDPKFRLYPVKVLW
jgi:PIN domain nuclease of toxin-antitoxin system